MKASPAKAASPAKVAATAVATAARLAELTAAIDSQRAREIAKLQQEVTHLHECVELVKNVGNRNAELIKENTEITTQVRDILASFRILGSVAKWFTYIVGAIGAVYAAWKGIPR